MEARSVLVSALLWGRARGVGNWWTVGQLERFKDAVQWEIETGDIAQDRPTESVSSGGAMGNAEETDVGDTPRQFDNVGCMALDKQDKQEDRHRVPAA